MEKIAIIGAGGFGREVRVLIEQINNIEKKYEIIGFFDDAFEKGEKINDLPVLGDVSSLNSINYNLNVVLGVAEPMIKKKIINKIKNDFILFPTLKHPSAIVPEVDVVIGQGSIICAGCIITCNIKLKEFITLNLSCTVGHDTIIEDFCSFMPTVNISGEVVIEKGVYIGTGAKVINQLKIGENTIVGAGAVVAKSLPANCTAVGIPAKPIKFHH
ncbi:acetyltransferase [Polaribacter sp. MSW13]|uniref:Acetyltransferase n=1 Tax=Polaribacter marinus TaxID=2916838 RepID=A0A9X1VKB8_9FLAO|nr:acetyltransferase [Polaribacter marinus]MCI2227553.1 acetyltransferase [Polaribacter marinus]